MPNWGAIDEGEKAYNNGVAVAGRAWVLPSTGYFLQELLWLTVGLVLKTVDVPDSSTLRILVLCVVKTMLTHHSIWQR